MTLPVTALILLGLGGLVLLGGGIMVLVAAFRQSIAWGLVALFVPCGNLVFTVVHWAEAKKGTLLSLLGAPAIGGGAFMAQNEMRAALAKVGPLGMLATTKAPEKDLTAQIAEKRAQLEARHAGLPPGDAALYQTRTSKRKQRFAEIEAAQRERARTAKRVVMDSTSSCPAWVSAKQYFAQKGVDFQEIDVEKVADGRAGSAQGFSPATASVTAFRRFSGRSCFSASARRATAAGAASRAGSGRTRPVTRSRAGGCGHRARSCTASVRSASGWPACAA